MSTTHAAEHDHHGHGAGGDHVPHVLPMRVYIATWLTLLVLTVVTVGASYMNLGHAGNLIVAMLIASIKASVVALIFMHLKWDHKFHSVIFVMSLLFLAVFIAFTMFDTEFRGRAEPVENLHPADVKAPFAGGEAPPEPKDLAPAAEGEGHGEGHGAEKPAEHKAEEHK